ncbi:GumC family protein [Jejuia pallidilutea]|uniref:Tyrosine-protein kinase Wzc n=1 Tax=Jejuia pallidilutea TaxID=504487 RepID=A0A090VPE3_9FLAO|nr:hypothetical protein [Jejuia pallidilutea]GAL65893.1 tyrosine-protein kinase Wzc [Jejuia pallidilutea]GAL88472.1 tyrosine-protein kinase Wzc [Jejuia pallidilutea]
MKPIDFIKLILKHKTILTVVPLIFGLLAVLLTINPKRSYYSETMLYTGIASGSSIEMDKTFNYLAANNAFDNLINVIKSRDTQEEVAIRLLSQHLSLRKPNHKFISDESYEALMEILPEDLKSYLATNKNLDENGNLDYETTVLYLTELMNSDNSNFVYSLLSFDDPHYSLEAISKVKVERISSSDLVKLSYEIDDPGICQQTLKIYIDVCTKKYKDLKENGSDTVVKYFEAQLSESEKKLKAIEQKLLKFNQDNNIINYYEQSKAVAIVKEDMDVAYKKGMAQLAGSEASAQRLEQKLAIQELIQQKNNAIVDSKKELGELNYKIGMYAAKSSNNETSKQHLENLKKQAKALQKEIKTNVDELYTFQNSTDGVPIKKVLPDWVDKTVESEDLKAKLSVMNQQNKAIEKQFATYAPAGANLKRIEREINVAEQEYLEILHGLNLAKLKFQDAQLSSNLTAVDPPFYPLKPMPSKRKIIIIAIVFITGIIILATILFMEFFDDTLKNEQKASEKLQIPSMGMLPKLFRAKPHLDLVKMQDRLMDFVMQNFHQNFKAQNNTKTPKIITVFSTRDNEGKSVITANIAKRLKASGYSVLVLNHSNEDKSKTSVSKSPWLYKFLGYQDPRIDYNHPFLSQTTAGLSASEYYVYNKSIAYRDVKNYDELSFEVSEKNNQNTDYILIELPNLIEFNYPSELIANSDLALLVCRSNRLWTKADHNILDHVKGLVGEKIKFIINGVDIKEVETVLGELPKQRSKTRVRIKNMFRFQFFTSNHI